LDDGGIVPKKDGFAGFNLKTCKHEDYFIVIIGCDFVERFLREPRKEGERENYGIVRTCL